MNAYLEIARKNKGLLLIGVAAVVLYAGYDFVLYGALSHPGVSGLILGQGGSGLAGPTRGTPAGTVSYSRQTVSDPRAEAEGSQGGPFSVLVPKGWQMEGGVTWAPHLPEPAYINVKIAAADGVYVGVTQRQFTESVDEARMIGNYQRVPQWVCQKLGVQSTAIQTGQLRQFPGLVSMYLLPVSLEGRFNGAECMVRTTVIVVPQSWGLSCSFIPIVVVSPTPGGIQKHIDEIVTICSSVMVNPKWEHIYLGVVAALTNNPAPSEDAVQEETKKDQATFDAANEDWDKYVRGVVDVDDENGHTFKGWNGKEYFKCPDNSIREEPYGTMLDSNYRKLQQR